MYHASLLSNIHICSSSAYSAVRLSTVAGMLQGTFTGAANGVWRPVCRLLIVL